MKIKVMSFNVRIDVESDEKNYFFNRKERVLDVIQDESPDIIGFQETTQKIREWLLDNITDEYILIGCGRDADRWGESNSIAYKKHMFELYSFETKQLSFTPSVPGSRFEGIGQNCHPRIFCHAALINPSLGSPLHFFNTHLDNRSPEVRSISMSVILQHISECDGKIVLTGDMNALPSETSVKMPCELPNRHIVDASASIDRTFHRFGVFPDDITKIDYIYTDANVIKCYARNDGEKDGVWISDHFPLVAVLDV